MYENVIHSFKALISYRFRIIYERNITVFFFTVLVEVYCQFSCAKEDVNAAEPGI